MRTRFPTSSDNNRICPRCGRKVSRSYSGSLCPKCDDEILYKEVKEYIRSNNVTELMVADHFGIPLATVQSWIKEGYLTYKSDDSITPL